MCHDHESCEKDMQLIKEQYGEAVSCAECTHLQQGYFWFCEVNGYRGYPKEFSPCLLFCPKKKQKSKTEKLAFIIAKLVEQHQEEINNLSYRGPLGGRNAKTIEGWVPSPNGTITRAANLADCPTMPYWSGFNSTPSTAIPACIEDAAWIAWHDLFEIQ